MATTDKYDRQLRLWGANGQRRLMTSHILLIHANGVGAETLKNLVLPGVGNFTILDDYIVNHNDLSANFFVTAESVGKPRAEVVRDLLCEMNPDVNGLARVANFQNILQTEPSFFESFQLIITANLPESHVLPLSQLCFEKRINLVILRSFGLIGAIRLQLTTHSIIEAKKDQTSFDLRICDSFPALADYCANYPDFQSLNSMEHAHIPFIVILYRALQHWKESHQGNVPSTAADKKEFQEAVKRLSHNLNNEVNFQEALKDYYYAYKRSTPSSELQALIDKQRQRQLGKDDEAFNFLIRSLQIFLEQNNSIVPLSGLLPDMTSTTDSYVQLQSIFHEKAAQDRALFKQILLQQLQHVGTDLQISEEDVEIFCKNCQTVAQIETTSFHNEVVNGAESSTAETIIDVLQNDLYEDPAQTPLIWYLGLRAVDAFYQKYARWPGSSDDTVQHDQQEVFQELSHLARSIQIPSELIASNDLAGSEAMETEGNTPLISLAHAVEMTRYGGHEFHNICSIIGGIAAQEVVKIITHQYEPLNNTYIFNGIACCGAVYSL